MPVALFVGDTRAMKKKANLRPAFGGLQTKRIVLIVLPKLLGSKSALPHDVRSASIARHAHPGLDCDGVVQVKSQLFTVLHLDKRLFAIAREAHGSVLLRKSRISGRTWSRLLAVVKGPLHHGRPLRFVGHIIARGVILTRSNGDQREEEEERKTELHADRNVRSSPNSANLAPHFREGEMCGHWGDDAYAAARGRTWVCLCLLVTKIIMESIGASVSGVRFLLDCEPCLAHLNEL